MEENNLTQKIAECIVPYRKRTERMVGYIPYSLNFEIREYNGVSQMPEKVSVLEKTIVYLIDNGDNDIRIISKLLGLDFDYDIEKNIIFEALYSLRHRLKMVEGKNNTLSLTEIGKDFVKEGQYIKRIHKSFRIWVNPEYPFVTYLMESLEDSNCIVFGKRSKDGEALSLKQIRNIAEWQANSVQFSENGLELIKAELRELIKCEAQIYVCFLQSIRDNSVRTIVYNPNSNSVIEKLNLFFDENEELKDTLLTKCLGKEILNDNIEKVEAQEKSIEQIESEKRIIAVADEKGEVISGEDKNDYNSKVGSIYDTAEFESVFNDIFEKHNNDEIWLISPWLKYNAFIKHRLPAIRKFLDMGGTMFVGFSEPEKPGVEMVDKTSMNKVKELDNLYEKFYYAELPKFHSKNVIEYKGGVTSLYTGSFNILSFSIHGHEEHFRMEQMSFANKKSAEKMRKDYLNRFAQKYVNEFANKMIKSPDKSNIDFSKIKYLKTIEDINTTISRLDDIAKEANIQIKYKEFPNDNILVKIAESILKRKYIPNNIELQYQLSASLFLYDLGRTKKKNEYCDMAIRKIEELLSRNSIYDICQFVIIKSKDGNSKITINIVCNGFYFEFADIIIKMAVFKSVSKHKVNFNFKENHIIEAKYKIRNLLYNASRNIKVQDGDK